MPMTSPASVVRRAASTRGRGHVSGRLRLADLRKDPGRKLHVVPPDLAAEHVARTTQCRRDVSGNQRREAVDERLGRQRQADLDDLVTEPVECLYRDLQRLAILGMQHAAEAGIVAERDAHPARVAPRLLEVRPCGRWQPGELLRVIAGSRIEQRCTIAHGARNDVLAVEPHQSSCARGPIGLRPRLVLRPTSPQFDAGVRIEPPPSEPFAAGTIRAATAAAEPPLEPPGVRSRFHGLRVGPNSSGSVTLVSPNSGVLVLPKITNPAARNDA